MGHFWRISLKQKLLKIHLFFSLGSSPVISKMYVDPSVTGNCPLVIPYPNPYVPPFPAPTLSQPLAQLRQPYIVTLASNAKSSTTKKQSEELIPIRLAVAFASSRASAKQVGNIFHRYVWINCFHSYFRSAVDLHCVNQLVFVNSLFICIFVTKSSKLAICCLFVLGKSTVMYVFFL